ncbi:MAG: DUF4112 domain-containing protein [Microthrixaceae bacterium]
MADVRDLGPIEGREVPPNWAPRQAPVPDAVPPPNVPPPAGPPTGSPAPPNWAPPTGSPLPAPAPGPLPALPSPAAVRDETVQALRDIREAHRRGPKPNQRPLPQWVKRLAWVLDDSIPVPATGGRRVGLDGILTFVPGIGDAAGVVLSMVVVLAGVGAGVSLPTTLRMLLNVGLEGLVGLVPFGGALFDLAYKANNRNVRLIERDLADRRGTRRSSLAVLALAVLTVIIGALMTLLAFMAGIALFAWFLYWLAGRLG